MLAEHGLQPFEQPWAVLHSTTVIKGSLHFFCINDKKGRANVHFTHLVHQIHWDREMTQPLNADCWVKTFHNPKLLVVVKPHAHLVVVGSGVVPEIGVLLGILIQLQQGLGRLPQWGQCDVARVTAVLLLMGEEHGPTPVGAEGDHGPSMVRLDRRVIKSLPGLGAA